MINFERPIKAKICPFFGISRQSAFQISSPAQLPNLKWKVNISRNLVKTLIFKISVAILLFAIFGTALAGTVRAIEGCENCVSGGHPVFVRHPEFCNWYVVCQGGAEMPCPPGLVFNPSLSVCDWRCNVDCEGRGDKEVPQPFPPRS